MPVSNQPSPPIFKLNPDLLWFIFSLNTPGDDDFVDPFRSHSLFTLVTTRHTSQVCRPWRELMLESPSLWANSIELDVLNQTGDNWRQEIIRRTGTALLSVLGEVKGNAPSTTFFFALIENDLSRLRRLNVLIQDETISQDPGWHSLRRPVPNLEVFRVDFLDQDHAKLFPSDTIFFADAAPCLHSLIVRAMKFKLSGPWVSQIRRLSLFHCSIAVSELLSTLANMSSLEILQVGYMEQPNPHIKRHHWPTVALPRLKRLFISDTVQTLNIFLGHMALPLSICLFADSRSYEPNIESSTSDDFSIFGKSLVAYFQSHSVQKCQANILSCAMESELLIVNILQASEIPLPTHIPRHQFTFSTGPIPPGPLPAHALVCTILRSFASSDLSNITILDINLVNSTLDRSDVDLISFLKALVKVEEIQTGSIMLQILLDIKSDGFLLLPSLRTICFNSSEDLKSDIIMRFLLHRRDAGVPIKKFDLTSCSSFAPVQLLFLEGINGLVVLWDQEMREGIGEWLRSKRDGVDA